MSQEGLFDRMRVGVDSEEERPGLRALSGSLESHMTRVFGRMRRLEVASIALILFVLMLNASVSVDLNLGFVRVNDSGVLLNTLPAVVALLGLEIVITFVHYRATRRAYDEAMRLLYPRLAETGVHRLLRPSTTLLLFDIPWPDPQSAFRRVVAGLSNLEDLLLVVVIAWFLVWWFCFVAAHHVVLAVLSRFVVVLFVAYGALVRIAGARSGLLGTSTRAPAP